MTRDEMKDLLDRIIDATAARDAHSDEDAERPQVGSPASPSQIAAVEQRWGFRLPPTYRTLLSVYDGVDPFWFDVPLLSTTDIVEDTKDLATFAEFFSKLWRTIFACGTESYDALAFDPEAVDADGEMQVVLLNEAGEDMRWDNLAAFLVDHLQRVRSEASAEQADRDALED